MPAILDSTFVTFWKEGRYIFAAICFDGSLEEVPVLMAFDHQELIQTLEEIWPIWKDSEQHSRKRVAA